MRLIASFEKESEAKLFSTFLEKENIKNRFEPSYDSSIKKLFYNIWIHSEDDFSKASDLYKKFISMSKNEPISQEYNLATKSPIKKNSSTQNLKTTPIQFKPAKFTLFLIALCFVVFVIDLFQVLSIQNRYDLKNLLVLTPIQKLFMYDIDKARLEADSLILKYHISSEKDIDSLPENAKNEILQIDTSTWRGFYYLALSKFAKSPKPAVLFGKIRQGQIWRIFTPAILHGGLFHILLNMLWLWYLGRMIEPRLKFLRYLFFILISAAISNTSQYLMSGPLFLGFSGVITAMMGYIFIKQKTTPWEGYNVPNFLFYVIGIFFLASLALQIFSFFLELFKSNFAFDFSIANTAHISGVLCGMALAKIPFFSWRMK